ncbi:MAG TPA: hypothetical protein VFT68_02355 [Lapillicoccus sp.]|nr:hypothetical protein [Lapillicoccus sp.]
MTEQDRAHAAPPADPADVAGPATSVAPARPVPDLGFFAGAPQPRDGGAFGGAPSSGGQFGAFGAPAAPPGQLGGPAPGQFGGAPSQFGGAPADQFGQFGAAGPGFGNPSSPFGAPAYPGPIGAPPGAGTGFGSTTKLVVAGVAVVLLLVAVFGGRFAWQQFVADPVLPDTLGGLPRAADTDADLSSMQQGVTDQLAAGGTAKVGLYTDGQGSGYVLVAVRGGSDSTDPGSEPDVLATWTKTEQDGTTCFTNPAQAAQGLGVTMCVQGFWRRAVLVLGMGVTPPDPAVVAQVTGEAWDAQ